MSFRSDKILSLAGEDFSKKTKKDLIDQFLKILNNGIHGLCFSPYMDGQGPGSVLSKEQISRRVEIIKPYTKWIRTFSCTDGNEMIPEIAKAHGMKVMAGAWLGDDEEMNEKEIANLIKIVKAGHVDLVAVGNEVLYREEMTEEELLNYIRRVKIAVPEAQIGYVDAYYEFTSRPALKDACDILFVNCYPYWEGCHIDYSLVYMQNMYNSVKRVADGKRVIISETGWPNIGTAFEGSEPSKVNALRYFINAQKWSIKDNIEMIYFSSFDEEWKIDSEGDVGAFWGLWDKNEMLKYEK